MCGALIVYRWHSVWQQGWPEKVQAGRLVWVLHARLQGPLWASLRELARGGKAGGPLGQAPLGE